MYKTPPLQEFTAATGKWIAWIAMLLPLPSIGQSGGQTPAECQLCAPSGGWELDVELGPAYVPDDDFKFGDYTGLDEDGVYLFGNVFGRYRGKNAEYLRIEGYRLGQDSRAIFVEGGKQSRYEVRASYQGIPRKIFDTTVTPYGGNGSDRLSLPAGWVRAPGTQGMTQLGNSLQTVDIERDWDIYKAGLTFKPARRWSVNMDYKRQERDGKAVSGGSFFFDAAQFAKPIDYETDELQASIDYTTGKWQISLGYFGSFFDNNDTSLVWDNAYASQNPGDNSGQLALAPDNRANQLTLAGSILLPARTTVSGQISLGRMKQDDKLLPYTTNALIPVTPLPRTRADAEVDTTNINLRATSSPLEKFTLEGEFRYNERDNDTPERVYDYVVTDEFLALAPAQNIAYDYQRYNYKLRGEYRIRPRTQLSAGLDYERYERTSQERNRTNTGRIWTSVNARPVNFADIDVELYTESRDGSNYKTFNGTSSPQNPLMRKYNMADRDREGISTYTSFYASDRTNVGVDIEYNRDRYNDTDIGLENSRYMRYGADASYVFNRNVVAYASFYSEKIKSKQANSQSFANPDWFARTDDKFYTSTLGLRYPGILGKLGADIEYTYARSTGEIENNTSGLESDFPTLRSKLHQLKLGLDYPWRKDLTLKFGYMYQKYSTEDWALDGVEPDTVTNLLSLGADPYDYNAHVFFVGVRYLFDSRGNSGPRLRGN